MKEVFVVHAYEIRKRGNGVSVESVTMLQGLKLYPLLEKIGNMDLKNKDKLPKIKDVKKLYKDTRKTFSFIYDHDIMAPSEVYQVIVECPTQGKMEWWKKTMTVGVWLGSLGTVTKHTWYNEIGDEEWKKFSEY